jgi:hypothetical protein
MKKEDRCKLALYKGVKYDKENGIITNSRGKVIDRVTSNNYLVVQIYDNESRKRYCIQAHHFAWYYVYGNCDFEEIDHINRDKTDNKITNLRPVSRNQNQWNRSNTKGYTFNKLQNKWHSKIRHNKKLISLGYYKTESEAREAYLKAKEKYHII